MPRFGYARMGRRGMAQSMGAAAAAVTPTNINFWETNGGVFYVLTPYLCQEMIDQVLEAMQKALVSGVVEYKVGSRGLKRFTMKDLQDLLGFWLNQLEASIWGGSIIARRSIPTDT